MRPYLSIDLDFWNERSVPFDWIESLISECKNVTMVCEHHHMLKHINASKCQTLINVDWHSDLSGYNNDIILHDGRLHPIAKPKKFTPLNCGTWVDRVSWAKSGTFVWVFPQKKCDWPQGTGRCDGKDDAFIKGRTAWKLASRKLSRKMIPDVTTPDALGICLSPDYLELRGDHAQQTLEWFKDKSKQMGFLTAKEEKWINSYIPTCEAIKKSRTNLSPEEFVMISDE